MKGLRYAGFVITLVATATDAYSAPPRIEKGKVVVTLSSGSVRELGVGGVAFDLWTSPDPSFLTFAAAAGTLAGDPEPLYKSSSIYVAARDSDYAPVLLLRGPLTIGSLRLERFYGPRFGPDGKTVYVKAGYTMTTDVVLAVDAVSREVRFVGHATDFRVIWGGPYNGQLLFMVRHLPDDASSGISYQCRVGLSPADSRVVHSNCADFLAFTREWAKPHGASVQ